MNAGPGTIFTTDLHVGDTVRQGHHEWTVAQVGHGGALLTREPDWRHIVCHVENGKKSMIELLTEGETSCGRCLHTDLGHGEWGRDN